MPVDHRIEALDRAIHTAALLGGEPLFISDARFEKDKALVTRVGPLVMVTATPFWWSTAFDAIRGEAGVIFRDGAHPIRTFKGVQVRKLHGLLDHPHWPLILEAIHRQKLVDFSAFFCEKS